MHLRLVTAEETRARSLASPHPGAVRVHLGPRSMTGRGARSSPGTIGRPAAIDLPGGGLGLPAAIRGHNPHGHWGPPGATGEVVIVIAGIGEMLAEAYASVDRAGTIRSRYAMPYENDLPLPGPPHVLPGDSARDETP